jgi:hypothetical protein
LALQLARRENDTSGGGFTRVTFEWDAAGREAKLVIEPDHSARLRLHVTVGSDREEHELDLDGPGGGLEAINSASQLIKIEETGSSLPEAQRVPTAPHEKATRAHARSKLITIEDLSASLPEARLYVG